MNMRIDRNELTSLITRLEEEYGKAKAPWKAVTAQVIPEVGVPYYLDSADEFVISAVNSMPTLLSALKYYMAVAEELKAAKCLPHECQYREVVKKYDTPSLLSDKT